jgi:hypothetical protein
MLAPGTGHTERLPIPDRCRPGSGVTAPRAAAGARRPGRPLGARQPDSTASPPRAPDRLLGRRGRSVRRPRAEPSRPPRGSSCAVARLGSGRRPGRAPRPARGPGLLVPDWPAPESAHAQPRGEAGRCRRRASALKGPGNWRSPSGGRVLSSVSCWSGLGYEARRRRTGRFADADASADVADVTFASSFRPRLALSVSTRSVVGGRASTSTRWIS